MASPVIVITTIASALGLILNSLILYLVLHHAKHLYHYLFAGILLICAIWDLGVLLTMVRNQYPQELILYGYIATFIAIFLPTLVHHFSFSYIGTKPGWSVWMFWALSILTFLGPFFGFYGRIDEVHQYSWGNIFQFSQSGMPTWAILGFWFMIMGSSIYVLYQGKRRATGSIDRRHFTYIIAGFSALMLAVVKVVVIMKIDIPWILPFGMIMNDTFAALIGIAIVKEKLLDITLIIKRGALYSLLAALIIFIFSFSEHILVNYLGQLIGGHSGVIHFVSIGLVIAVLMPVKHRLERLINKVFQDRSYQF